MEFHDFGYVPFSGPVRYRDQRALVAIETLTVLRGKISPRVLGLVVEWAARHEREPMDGWELARAQQQLRPIEPLE